MGTGCEVVNALLGTPPNRKTHAPRVRRVFGRVRQVVRGGGLKQRKGAVSEPASISLGIAQRYALALFDLSKEAKALKALEADVDALGEALAGSADLAEMIASPVITRDDQARAMGAVAKALGLSTLMQNTLALMGQKRRLFVLPQLVADLRDRIAAEKGEMTADVTSATKLTAAQAKKLADVLKSKVGKDVKLNATVDESLIGGLIVKLGSTMIDTSVKAKLASLQNAMKEVG